MGKVMVIKNKAQIEDKELDLYLRTTYPSKLEEELLKTGYRYVYRRSYRKISRKKWIYH